VGPVSGWAEPVSSWVEPGRWEEPGNGRDQPGRPDEPGGLHERGAGAGPEPAAEAGPQAAFWPWETYETAEGDSWDGGYGVVPGQGWAQSYDDDPAEPAHGAARGGAATGPAGAHAGDTVPDDDVPYGAHVAGDPYAAGGAHAADGARAPGGAPTAGAYEADGGHEADGARRAGGAHAGPRAHPGQGAQAGYGTIAPEPEAPPEHGEPPQWQAESADSLTADLLLPGRPAAPPAGWRRALYQVTGGLVRAPQSAADRRRMDLVQRARTPVAGGHHRVAVLSLKGGVGKTTTTVGLGSTLASVRGDRVIAVDANPDRGTLSDKLRLETAATVRDLLNEEDQVRRYADVRAYTTQSPSGLEVLASDRDPTVSVAFSDQDYVDVARVLEHYYSVSITDCGTGLLHSAMAGVLRLADQIVLVSSPSVDGARSASATLDWLAAHNYGDLVRGAVVVLSAIRPRSKSAVDLARLEQHFAARCRAVVRIPYDAHLEEGAEVDLTQLSRATADAYLVLAAEVGDGFSWPRH
jgi:MinD-like ATPase involved in chromosome partitioning or flagellar assembly